MIAGPTPVRLAAGTAVMLALGGTAPMARPGGAAAKAVTIVAKEFLYEPKEAVAGTGEITFVVRNEGAIEHNFLVQDATQKKVAEIAIIEPGAVETAAATLAPGIYTIICTLPGHRQAGMVASLKVAR